MPAGGSPARTPSIRSIQWAQALVLAALFCFPVLMCLRAGCVNDPDVWWHLRTGEWIAQHHAVPQTDPFTSFGAGKRWEAYSWLFELLIFGAYQWLGLAGIVAFTTAMAAAIAAALHGMLRRLQGDFSFAVALTGVGIYSLVRLYTPRPWLFTILFFVLELDLLLQARRTGRMRLLLWLPALFALWANVHIQFIDGLVVLALAAGESLLAVRWSRIETRLQPGWLCGISLACVLAPLANPYGWRIYQAAYELATQPGVLNQVSELSAIPFRHLDDWLVLSLVLAATAVLARERRFEFFETALLAFAVLTAFRSQRDIWVAVIAASAILAVRLKGDEKNRFRLTVRFAPFVAALTVLVGAVGAVLLHVDNARLSANLARSLPVRAVEAAREKGWSGPVYNDYDWGGYLIWSLRLPVSIDGRAALDGDPRIDRSVATWGGQPDWASDPDLEKANLVIGPVTTPLTQLLRLDPAFQLVYEDKLAAVFVRRKSLASAGAPLAAAKAGQAPIDRQ